MAGAPAHVHARVPMLSLLALVLVLVALSLLRTRPVKNSPPPGQQPGASPPRRTTVEPPDFGAGDRRIAGLLEGDIVRDDGGQLPASVLVKVVDATREGIADAFVSAEPVEAANMSTACMTDARGVCRVETSSRGLWLVTARADGYGASTQSVEPRKSLDRELVITLRPAAVIRGHVVMADGEGAGGTLIRTCNHAGICCVGEQTRSDRVGEFRVEVAPGRYRLRGVHLAGVFESDEVEARAGEEHDLGEIALSPAAAVRVHATIDGVDECLRGFVQVDSGRGYFDLDRRAIRAGWATLLGLSLGRHHLFVRCEAAPASSDAVELDIDVDGPTEVTVDLRSGTIVRGRVLDADTGEPLGNVQVSAKRSSSAYASAHTSESGEFALALAGEGDACTVSVRGDARVDTFADCGLVAGTQAAPVELRVGAATGVRGHVELAGGGGLAGASLELLDAAGEVVGRATSGTAGAFVVQGSSPAGLHQLCAVFDELAACASIDLVSGELAGHDLVLECGTRAVRGRVEDAAGDGVADAELELRVVGSPRPVELTSTAGGGEFELPRVPTCVESELVVRAAGRRERVAIPTDGDFLHVELAPTRRVDVTIACNPSDTRSGEARIEVQMPSDIVPLAVTTLYGHQRTTRFMGMPVGELTVRASVLDRSTSVTLPLGTEAGAVTLDCPSAD